MPDHPGLGLCRDTGHWMARASRAGADNAFCAHHIGDRIARRHLYRPAGDGARPCLVLARCPPRVVRRSEEHTSELQSLMRNSYAVFCLKKKNTYNYVAAITSSVLHHTVT